jgi:membrane protease YdiL (CAAX protease family)
MSRFWPMDQPGLPPVISEPAPPAPSIGRWRWWVHLSILTAYPILMGLAGAFMQPGKGPLLPSDPLQLAAGVGNELLLFGLVFLLAWSASRASFEDLRLGWTRGLTPVGRGFLYGIGLQVAVMLLGIIIRAIVAISGGQVEALDKLQPEYERLVDPNELANKPIYLWMNVTLVSFVMGGLREEFWRSGMLAGLGGVAPKVFGTPKGQVWAVCVTAVCFGLGHLAQGWGGVVVTSILGVALGMILLWHRTIWTAVFAHGFFDAASFWLIYLVAKYAPEQLHKIG